MVWINGLLNQVTRNGIWMRINIEQNEQTRDNLKFVLRIKCNLASSHLLKLVIKALFIMLNVQYRLYKKELFSTICNSVIDRLFFVATRQISSMTLIPRTHILSLVNQCSTLTYLRCQVWNTSGISPFQFIRNFRTQRMVPHVIVRSRREKIPQMLLIHTMVT